MTTCRKNFTFSCPSTQAVSLTAFFQFFFLKASLSSKLLLKGHIFFCYLPSLYVLAMLTNDHAWYLKIFRINLAHRCPGFQACFIVIAQVLISQICFISQRSKQATSLLPQQSGRWNWICPTWGATIFQNTHHFLLPNLALKDYFRNSLTQMCPTWN